MKGRLTPILLVLGVAALIVAPLGRTDYIIYILSLLADLFDRRDGAEPDARLRRTDFVGAGLVHGDRRLCDGAH